MKICFLCKARTHDGGYLAKVPLCKKHTDVLMVRHMMYRLGVSFADLEQTKNLADDFNPNPSTT